MERADVVRAQSATNATPADQVGHRHVAPAIYIGNCFMSFAGSSVLLDNNDFSILFDYYSSCCMVLVFHALGIILVFISFMVSLILRLRIRLACSLVNAGYYGLGSRSSDGCIQCFCSGHSSNCSTATRWRAAVVYTGFMLPSSDGSDVIPYENNEPWTGIDNYGELLNVTAARAVDSPVTM